MVFAASMFLLCASLPLVRSLPSFNINIGVPPNCAIISISLAVSIFLVLYKGYPHIYCVITGDGDGRI
jgi:hypothetical protein